MNTLQRESAIKRLQEMAERLPDGSFDKTAVNAAVGDMMLQIPGQVKYGGGAWRCFQCGAVVQPKANHCGHCGKRLEWPLSGEGRPEDDGESYKEQLIHGLQQLKVQTGSLACMGCQHEDNCGIKGCALIRAVVEQLEVLQGVEEWMQKQAKKQATSDKSSD